MKGTQSRWKNIALTVYLICPLALVTLLCVWIWIALEQRVENAGRMRGPPDRGDASAETAADDPPPVDADPGAVDSGAVDSETIEKPAGNSGQRPDEPGG